MRHQELVERLQALEAEIRERARQNRESRVWACQTESTWHADEYEQWADELAALSASGQEGAAPSPRAECDVQPEGWRCTRPSGHDGPCAAVPDPVVGHATFSDGHHEPIRQSEAAAIIAESDAAKARRAEQMPDERTAIKCMFSAWLRLKELGWKQAEYCPKDGSLFDVIEPGSTGIHRCRYQGEWPKGSWWIEGDGDLWPSRPVLFRPLGAPPEGTEPAAQPQCQLPPPGWWCSRGAGHDGPCAARREGSNV